MDLRHLRYFIALAERLSFTRAAASVHVTQSTLSHQIRNLEEELGCALFERSSRAV
jgi:LysR family cyn operon transcriptional activator